MVEQAIHATVFTMLILFAFLLFINWLRPKNTCPICGDSCKGNFCCEAHENLHYDEEEFSRMEVMDEDDEQGEMEREERISKALP